MNKSYTILVIDDMVDIQDILTYRLSKLGYRVFSGSNGQEAVELAKEHVPNLILMDLSMPVMDGTQATRTIRADPALAHIPIIALSGHIDKEDRDMLLEAGFNDLWTKPMKVKLLVENINRWLNPDVNLVGGDEY